MGPGVHAGLRESGCPTPGSTRRRTSGTSRPGPSGRSTAARSVSWASEGSGPLSRNGSCPSAPRCGRCVAAICRGPIPGVELVGDVHQLADGLDHLVIVAPLTDATRGLVDETVLGATAPDSHLVNVARGPIVGRGPRCARGARRRSPRLRQHRRLPIRNPCPAGHWMYAHPGVRLSAHISWNWSGAGDGLFETFRENLAHFLAGSSGSSPSSSRRAGCSSASSSPATRCFSSPALSSPPT